MFDPKALTRAQRRVVARKAKYPGARGHIPSPTMRCLIRKEAVRVVAGDLDGLFAWELTADALAWAKEQNDGQ